MRRLLPIALAALVLAPATPAPAKESVLPVPRFVSLRAAEVNLRTGPGDRYPVEWVLMRRAMPVEITAEFDNWRRVRDWEGTEGWVHQNMLVGRRTVVVMGQERVLRRDPAPTSEPAARLQAGVVARLLACPADWCRLEAGGVKGWIRRSEVWGVYPGEKVE